MSLPYDNKINIEEEEVEVEEVDKIKKIIITNENTDSVVFSIIEKFKERSDIGMKKYGTNLDRTDLNVLDWIKHAQEEHMDAILYLEKLKQTIVSPNSSDGVSRV